MLLALAVRGRSIKGVVWRNTCKRKDENRLETWGLPFQNALSCGEKTGEKPANIILAISVRVASTRVIAT